MVHRVRGPILLPDPVSSGLRIWEDSFPPIAAANRLELRRVSAEEAGRSEADAAAFLLRLLRESAWLRWCFPRALSERANGRFFRWLSQGGARKLGLTERAVKKIKGAFRGPLGERVYDVYLHDPELQRIFPWGLLPVGQLQFLSWMTTHGRADQNLSDEQILWFLQESAENPSRALALTYLVRQDLQQEFPLALTAAGWPAFSGWLARLAADFVRKRALRRRPSVLSRIDERLLERQAISGTAAPIRVVEGVNLLSHFCNPSGIQQAAIAIKIALERVGLETSCRDVPVPRKARPIARESWLGLEVYPVTILNHAPQPYFENGYDRAGLLRRQGIYRIGFWNWELERVPDDWVPVASLVDEIWSPTAFVAEAMRLRMPRPVYEMLPGVEIGPREAVQRTEFNIPEQNCVFLFMFDLHSQLHRKNPRGVVRAFRSAFRRDDAATLVIKATGGDIHREDFAQLQHICRGGNIILVHELMSRSRAYGTIEMCDCFVSLHRSEGFGLGLAEAMLLGKPVIGTAYSGNLAFMNRENSMLVDYEMVEIAEDRPIYSRGNVWAEPSVEHAAAYMRWIYENREEARTRAARVRPEIEQRLSLEAAGQRMRDRLEQITVS